MNANKPPSYTDLEALIMTVEIIEDSKTKASGSTSITIHH